MLETNLNVRLPNHLLSLGLSQGKSNTNDSIATKWA